MEERIDRLILFFFDVWLRSFGDGCETVHLNLLGVFPAKKSRRSLKEALCTYITAAIVEDVTASAIANATATESITTHITEGVSAISQSQQKVRLLRRLSLLLLRRRLLLSCVDESRSRLHHVVVVVLLRELLLLLVVVDVQHVEPHTIVKGGLVVDVLLLLLLHSLLVRH